MPVPHSGDENREPPGDRSSLATILVSTDRQYFQLGAKRSVASGLELLYMPGRESTPSGAVVWGLESEKGPLPLQERLRSTEAELSRLGGRVLRIYMRDPVRTRVADTLLERGYVRRREIAVLAPLPRVLERAGQEDEHELEWKEVVSDEHWAQKVHLHAAAAGQADGYEASARQWVGVERTKCATGGMRCFLVLRDASPVAAVGLMGSGGVARLKNLYVHPDARRSGVGLATVFLLAREAARGDYGHFGTFAVEGGGAIHVYGRAGLEPVASVTEFSTDLSASRPG